MNLLIEDVNKVFDYQSIEKKIYNLDNFSPNVACFPKAVFNKKFEHYFFINNLDWFNEKKDYEKLIGFVKDINSEGFIASCPSYYVLNAIAVSSSTPHENYISNHTYANINHKEKGLGLRKAHESFFYDKESKWAILSDFTHNTMIIGIEKDYVPAFKKHFENLYSDVNTFLNSLESFQGGKIDNKEAVLATYS